MLRTFLHHAGNRDVLLLLTNLIFNTQSRLLKLTVIPYTKQDSILSSQLEYRAETRGQKTHRLDSMNAAIAINNKTQFLTFNQRHYQTFTEDGLALLNI
jgi:predicted nucleic acid-binding protein